MKNWFFIIMLSIAALALAGTAAYFSVFGLTQLFYAAGIGITILAASLEFAKLVTVSYVYRFWNLIEKGLRGFYIFAVVFIMFLTSMGIYGFLTSSYQKSANKIELRDAQIKISENKKTLFVNQLDRINKSIESSSDRINTISGLRGQQEKRLDNLYDQKYISVAKRTEQQISGSDEQIKLLNDDITIKMQQTNAINDSIAFYDQKIAELKSSDISNEIGSYQFISSLTGVPMNKVVNIVVLLIILVFDPLAIGLLIGVNKLLMNKIPSETKESFLNRFRRKKKKDEVAEQVDEVAEQVSKQVEVAEQVFNPLDDTDWIQQYMPSNNVYVTEQVIEPEVIESENESEIKKVIEPEVITQSIENNFRILPIQKFDEKKKEYDEFEPRQVASVQVNTAHFVPNENL